jgi:NADPH2:quinone reductase
VEFNPTDPAENEVQVENKAIGINYIDTYIRSGSIRPVIAERPGDRGGRRGQ